MFLSLHNVLHNFWLLPAAEVSVGLAWKSATKSNDKLVNQYMQHCSYFGCPLSMLRLALKGAITSKIAKIQGKWEKQSILLGEHVWILKITIKNMNARHEATKRGWKFEPTNWGRLYFKK